MHDLDPLDATYVANILSKPPFVTVPGVINVRDLGSYPSTTQPGMVTKSKLLLRSAELSRITEEGTQSLADSSSDTYFEGSGKQILKDIGVTQVYDLRSDTEIKKYDASPPEIEGITYNHIPVFQTADYSPEMMAK
jgi:Tyrosine phosphatase family